MSLGDGLKCITFIINYIMSLVGMNVVFWVASYHSMNPPFISELNVGQFKIREMEGFQEYLKKGRSSKTGKAILEEG